MTTLSIRLGHHETSFADDDSTTYVAPIGSESLAAIIVSDPPLPEELTNAIGLFVDHLDDVVREVPAALTADTITLRGPGLQTLVDTLIGHPKGLPFDVGRDDSEEIFRTLATESAADRRHNPGLVAGEVHHVLGVSCAVVALHRGLRATQLTIAGEPHEDAP